MKIEERNGVLQVVDFDAAQAFKIACKIEQDGIAFYEALAGKMDPSPARESIVFLAGQERVHLAFFRKALLAAQKAGGDAFEEDDLVSFLDYDIFWPYAKAPALEKAVAEARNALNLGIIVERNSIRFYQACAEQVSSAEVRSGLSGIIEEEQKHRRMLEKMLAEI